MAYMLAIGSGPRHTIWYSGFLAAGRTAWQLGQQGRGNYSEDFVAFDLKGPQFRVLWVLWRWYNSRIGRFPSILVARTGYGLPEYSHMQES